MIAILEVSVQRKHLNKEEQKEDTARISELRNQLEAKQKDEAQLNQKITRIQKQRQVLDNFADKISNPAVPEPARDVCQYKKNLHFFVFFMYFPS